MAGYSGYSKSNNAVSAEANDRFPIGKASKVLAAKMSWSAAKAKAFLFAHGTYEWHHTSKMYNTTKYYDVSDEYLSEIRKELNAFEYKPKAKEKKQFFKCWNYDRDFESPRKLNWSITSREGNYTHQIKSIKIGLENLKKKLKADFQPGHKTRERIFKEDIAAIEEILTTFKNLTEG